MNNSQRIALIEQRLKQHLLPLQLEIIDDSWQHVGHPGAKQGGHFTIKIATPLFQSKSLLEAHRLIYAALDDLMKTDIHALQIEILKPYA